MAAIRSAFSVAGDGPALFMIHGIGARRATFDPMVNGLRDCFTCITYDMRGLGLSPLPDGYFNLADLVEELEALRLRLGIDRAHFAGHSLGGQIGPAYARRYPDRELSLGLWSTAALRNEDDSAKVKGVVAATREKGIPAVLDTLTARWFTDAFCVSHPEVIDWRKKQVIDTPPDVFLKVFEIFAGVETGPWLHQIAAPTQIITGENDGCCNLRLNQLTQQAIEGSELEILPELKHAIFIEATDQLLPHVRRFQLSQPG